MQDLPEGVLTFLLTDVEGSTRLWEEAPETMMDALRLHDRVITESVLDHNGITVKPRGEGDSQFIVFKSALDAVRGAVEMQRRLAEVDWPTPRPIRVRASLHTGDAHLDSGDYYGTTVNRAARLRAIAHGGQTVMSGATLQLVQDELPEGVSVNDMGRHRLKDLTRPEQVFQIDISGIDGRFPPLASLNSVSNNLPEQTTELIGREAELSELVSLLGENRLVTLLAPGGTGKTRLAIQAGADLAADYGDGVFFVALADISSSDEIVQAVAEAVGVSLSSNDDPLTQLLTYLAPRRQLLIFDNFEHVIDGAGVVAAILGSAPEVDVLATSRSRLNLTGEALLSLEGLDIEWDPDEEPTQVSGARLFLDAARRVRPELTVGPEGREALAEILLLTQGMPLAILMAASWADMLSVPEIAAEIAKNLDFLESRASDAPDRHRSIRAVFDYTWGLLQTREQDVFAALSVFRGGFTRQAGEFVAGASLRDLADLAGKSLVTPSPDTGRYSVHELLRQYAEAELAARPERQAEVLYRHAQFYTGLVDDAFDLFPRGKQVEMMSAIERDLDNIRTAWRHHVVSESIDGLTRMISGMWIAHEVRGWYQAILPLLEEALQVLRKDDEESRRVRAHLLSIHGATVALLGRTGEGGDEADSAVSIMRELGTTAELSFALHMRAQTLAYVGQMAEVRRTAEEGISVSSRPDPDWEHQAFWCAGTKVIGAFAAFLTGDVTRTAQLLEESSAVLEPLDELYYMTWNLGHRARVATAAGELDRAIELFTRSADRARRLGFLRGLQVSLSSLAALLLSKGDMQSAEEVIVESLTTAERTSMVPQMLGAMVQMGKVYAGTGRARGAVEILAAVEQEPAADIQLFTEPESIRAQAHSQLEALAGALDTDEYDAARAEGSSRSFPVLAKVIVDQALVESG